MRHEGKNLKMATGIRNIIPKGCSSDRFSFTPRAVNKSEALYIRTER